MSEQEWGLESEEEADFSSVDIPDREVEEEDNDDDQENEQDKVAEEIAKKIGEKVKEKVEDKNQEEPEEEVDKIDKESEEQAEEENIEFSGDSFNTRYSVTLRKALIDGTIKDIPHEEIKKNISDVEDAELLREIIDKDVVNDDVKDTLWERCEEIGGLTTDHLIQEGEYRYLPVFGFNINHVCTVPYRDASATDYEFDSIFVGDKVLSWWENDSLTPKHPYLLLNPIDSTKNTNHTADDVPYREIFRLPKSNQISFCDSGGFQMVSRPDAGRVDSAEEHDWNNAVLHPETVLDWQIDNADAGPILDHPPYGTAGESSIFSADDDNLAQWIDDPFLSYLEKTAENAKTMQDHLNERREDPDDIRAKDYKMFGVIQGHTFDQSLINGECRTLEEDKYDPDEERPHWYMLERWHEMVEDAGDFNAWALSPTPCTSPGQIGMHLSYAHNRCEDAEWFHVLQVGSSVNIALIQFYAMIADDKFVTSDASSHNRGSKYRQFMMPPGFGRSVTISDRDDRFERHPCNCKVCKKVEETHGFEYISEGADSKRNATINLHNLTMQLQSQRILDALMRAEGPEVIAGLKMDQEGDNIERFISPFWKQLRDVTTLSKIRSVYSAMLYTYASVKNGLQDKHDIWIKEAEYRQVEDEPDDGDVSIGKSAMDAWNSEESRGEQDSEDEEEDEEISLTSNQEFYLDLPTVRFDPPEDDEKKYYYQHTVSITGNNTEFDLSVTSDALNW